MAMRGQSQIAGYETGVWQPAGKAPAEARNDSEVAAGKPGARRVTRAELLRLKPPQPLATRGFLPCGRHEVADGGGDHYRYGIGGGAGSMLARPSNFTRTPADPVLPSTGHSYWPTGASVRNASSVPLRAENHPGLRMESTRYADPCCLFSAGPSRGHVRARTQAALTPGCGSTISNGPAKVCSLASGRAAWHASASSCSSSEDSATCGCSAAAALARYCVIEQLSWARTARPAITGLSACALCGCDGRLPRSVSAAAVPRVEPAAGMPQWRDMPGLDVLHRRWVIGAKITMPPHQDICNGPHAVLCCCHSARLKTSTAATAGVANRCVYAPATQHHWLAPNRALRLRLCRSLDPPLLLVYIETPPAGALRVCEIFQRGRWQPRPSLLTEPLHRRSSHKPSEAFLHAFKDRYGNTAAPEQGGSPAVTPFLLGPPPPRADSKAHNDSSTPIMDDEHFDSGSYQKNHFMDHHLFDLDPNGLDLTFGGGWAPSPHGPMSASGEMASTTALAAGSALDTPTSIGFSDSLNTTHFPPQSPVPGHPAFNNYGMIQHMGPVQAHFQPHPTFMGHAQTFNPQDSMIQQRQSNVMLPGGGFQLPGGAYGYHQAQPAEPTRAPTKAEREQEQFRFRVKLMAPTAMVAHEDDHPITYLNKRQPYTITITDTQPLNMPMQHVTYRTSIRVSFDDEPQRAKPSASWQLFREGRGQSEADERGSPELRAIEWVSPDQGGGGPSRAIVQKPHKEFFDGFSVLWSPTNHSSTVAEASLQLRCNFLSTDFSHSKGVKGIPVRLCCKTEIVQPMGIPAEPEIAYCKVKTFRDHGAERKLNNDRAHAEKNIEKLAREFEQSGSSTDVKDNGKRRRSDSTTKGPPTKKYRTNSMSSGSPEIDDADGQLEEKIKTLRVKLASGRDHSLLYLRGDTHDDPDSHAPDLLDSTGMSALQPPTLQHQSSSSTHRSVNQSPVSSSQSISRDWQQDSSVGRSYLPTPAPGVSRNPSASEAASSSSRPVSNGIMQQSNPQHLASPPEGPTKIKKQQMDEDGNINEWIEVIDNDKTYQAPFLSQNKPIACFYVKPTISGESLGDDYFRAIYLKQRTCKAFLEALCAKCGIRSDKVIEILRPQASGQYIKVEDDTIEHMREGQDMFAELELLDHDPSSYTDDDFIDQYRLKLIF
ncbi:hypothetical protein FH972_026180 [Carpinus fangiana]|uniref:Grh/CP2 DB domain-containing protein n=1 Tax=Carpinus fangiana TaxID=176857 RepID=A0A5N6L3K0_9ROSI|nr:hypothetical protein FH972_026180 [Carpinus fangiana]